ncbi:MAG: hypothetical protein H0V17_02040 [Deltaproteobacteria bacterium]|nr:hypothetical protein [Deltaproteobacteria bacterium]
MRNLSLVLFFAACGGGKDPVVIVDSPGSDGGGFFPNSRNDMVLVTFPEEGSGLSFTPDATDEPDNQASPLSVNDQTGGFKIEGIHDIAGDRSDEYFERDTFLISTAAGVNQLTVRLQWDGNSSDHDYFLLEEPAAGDTEPVAVSSGTLISNGVDMMGAVAPEFATFIVEPSKNYWLWTGVYMENAAPGGEPVLPSPYDFSVFGDSVAPTDFAGNCDVNEAGEGANGTAGNNNIVVFGGTGTKQAAGVNVAAGTSVLVCGTLNSGHFLADPDDATVGTDDVDTYAFNMAVDGDLLVTIIGETEADQTAIQALAATGLLAVALFNEPCTPAANATLCPDVDTVTAGVQPRPQQFFGTSEVDYFRTHGVTAFRMIKTSTPNSQNTGNAADIVGPSTLAVFMQSDAPGVLTANIKYRLRVTGDNRNTRAPRIAGAANVTEANDN